MVRELEKSNMTDWNNYSFGLGILLAATSCATSSGTKPHDMSTAEHESAASQEQQAAEMHGAQYSPDAKAQTQSCDPRMRACWTSTSNPTAQHKSDSADHEKLAAEHRAAAQALRDAEASACSGIEEQDRVTTPFYHREDIAQVTPAERQVSGLGHVNTSVPAGGRAVFRAVPGMTAEWLQRMVSCHIARASAVGHSMPEMNYCPLVLKNVRATVTSTGDGFAIDVTSEDAGTAAEIWRRMQALKQ